MLSYTTIWLDIKIKCSKIKTKEMQLALGSKENQ